MPTQLSPETIANIQQRIEEFCTTWLPKRREDKEILPRLIQELEGTTNTQDLQSELALLRLLVNASAQGLTRHAICATLYPGQPTHQMLDALNVARGRLNAALIRLESNFLSNYQVRIYPSPIDDPTFDDTARIEKLVTTTGALSANVPMHRVEFAHPQLRIACALYDTGDYSEAVVRFHDLIREMQHGYNFTNAEITQFLYYFAKSLLKLNWYDSLIAFLGGPYKRFSRLIQNELDSELLETAGIAYRQQKRYIEAMLCLEHAARILESEDQAHASAKLALSRADNYVLQIQVRLDVALTEESDTLVQEAAILQARAYLGRAWQHYHTFLKSVPEGTHYEGRLRGTQAFISVVEAELFPEQISLDQWAEAEQSARGGFEPVGQRKPFGIIAGKYALAAVWFAKGRWLLRSQSDKAQALILFQDALALLSTMYHDTIAQGHVVLGERFEMPKILMLIQLISSHLVALGVTPSSLVDGIPLVQATALQLGQERSIFTPLV